MNIYSHNHSVNIVAYHYVREIKNSKFPNMDYIEDKYLVLPIHLKVMISDAKYICQLINRYI